MYWHVQKAPTLTCPFVFLRQCAQPNSGGSNSCGVNHAEGASNTASGAPRHNHGKGGSDSNNDDANGDGDNNDQFKARSTRELRLRREAKAAGTRVSVLLACCFRGKKGFLLLKQHSDKESSQGHCHKPKMVNDKEDPWDVARQLCREDMGFLPNREDILGCPVLLHHRRGAGGSNDTVEPAHQIYVVQLPYHKRNEVMLRHQNGTSDTHDSCARLVSSHSHSILYSATSSYQCPAIILNVNA